MRLHILLLLSAGVLLCLPRCKSTPTSILLEVRAGAGLSEPDVLRLTIFDPEGVTVQARKLPENGSPELPSTVALFPDRESGKLRIFVQAMQSSAVIGEGTVAVELEKGKQISAVVTVEPGALPDRDHDGVPDEIDNCPDLPNPTQEPCGADGGLPDAIGDIPTPPDGLPDGVPDIYVGDGDLTIPDDLPQSDLYKHDLYKHDIDCDVDKDGHASAACGGSDCNDASAQAHPGGTEGPPGSASCGDTLDNDCDGDKDLTDTDCIACTTDAQCNDGSTCTSDSCVASLCQHAPANEGSNCNENKCVNGGKCTAGACVGNPKTCPVPTNSCKVENCDPAIGCVEDDKPNGTSCQDGDPCTSGETCQSGTCDTPPQPPECYIDGTCHADGATQGTCQVCDTSNSQTSWTITSGYCYISGTCRATGYTPDACHVCDPTSSTTSYTLESGYCYINGTCRAAGYKPNACRTCVPTTSQTSYVIDSGYCYIGGTCYQDGDSGTGCQICQTAKSKTSWSIKANCGIILVALNEGHAGNLGGLAGANALCQAQATAAGFTGTYKAFLSTTTQNVIDLIPSASAGQPVYNSKQQQLFSSWTSMFPAQWTTGRDLWSFDGKEVEELTGASPEWDDADVWHGSTGAGAVNTGLTCTDWTLATGNGACGEADLNTLMTTIETRSCALTLAVACVRIPN